MWSRYDQPGDDDSLWRYVPVLSLAWTLVHNKIWAPRADMLGPIDALEGGPSMAEAEKHAQYRTVTDDPIAENPPMPAYLKGALRRHAVSSWYLSEKESMAMWKLFAPQGVAMRIRAGDHYTIGANEAQDSGLVRYENLRDGETASFVNGPLDRGRFFRKDDSLSHEREFRILLFRDDRQDPFFDEGIELSFDCAKLIREIVASPEMKSFEFDALQAIVARWLPDVPVRRSAFAMPSPLQVLEKVYDDPYSTTTMVRGETASS